MPESSVLSSWRVPQRACKAAHIEAHRRFSCPPPWGKLRNPKSEKSEIISATKSKTLRVSTQNYRQKNKNKNKTPHLLSLHKRPSKPRCTKCVTENHLEAICIRHTWNGREFCIFFFWLSFLRYLILCIFKIWNAPNQKHVFWSLWNNLPCVARNQMNIFVVETSLTMYTIISMVSADIRAYGHLSLLPK